MKLLIVCGSFAEGNAYMSDKKIKLHEATLITRPNQFDGVAKGSKFVLVGSWHKTMDFETLGKNIMRHKLIQVTEYEPSP